MFLFILLWIPQIIHNAKTNNKYGYPFIYILSSTFDKLVYPFYFRGIKNNFLGSKDNFVLITIMISFVCITIIILYLQVLKGPRFMLSISINQSKYDFYKEKNELIDIRSNIGKEECVICLLPIFENENGIMIEMEDKSEKNCEKNENEEKIDNDAEIDDKREENNISNNDTCDTSILIPDSHSEGEKIDVNRNEFDNNYVNDILFISNDNNKRKSKDYDKIGLIEQKNNFSDFRKNKIFTAFYNIFKNIFKDVIFIFRLLFYENFFSFYKKSDNSEGKAYMYTPCNHVFHTQCLEQWLEYKKECPNCRTSMEEYL